MSSADNAPSPQSVTSQRFPTREVCGLIIFFWLALLPFSVNYLFFHPDERHYTDAGIIMCQTHDYLTPRDADGSPRLIKPILTYWIVVAGYQFFGITSSAARIPFLLLGGGCIGLGSLISHRIFGDRRTTLITAAILAVNPLICMASLTATPDIVQCFSLLLSAYGWIGLLKKGFSNVDAACAFVGAGLAIATKGTPGLLLLAYSLLFLWKNPWKRLDCRPLLTTKWVALGIGLALGWYVLAIATHGNEAIQQFIDDQVHSRLTRKWWSPFIQLPATPILFVLLIGPTSFLLLTIKLANVRKIWDSLTNDRRVCTAYILGWAASLFPLLAFVDPFSVRYFLLVVPLLTVPFAWLIVQSAFRPLGTFCRLGTNFILLAMGILVVIRLMLITTREFPLQMATTLLLVGLSLIVSTQFVFKNRRSVVSTTTFATRSLLLFV
ncbi:MAG: glycosyltransferase family 39 protein, partial [Planctomycetaceae bacterium]|nr:glycosyltransferase family 39 protein [Planctomycetaceae bacterium]